LPGLRLWRGPTPQLFRGENVTLRCYAQSIDIIDETNWSVSAVTVYNAATPASTLTITATNSPVWRFASFMDCWFLTNGICFIWSLPSNEDGKVLGTNALNVTNLCQIDNRLVLCGVSDTGGWLAGSRFTTLFDVYKETSPENIFAHAGLDFDDNWIVWSELGGGASDLPFHNMLMMLGVFGSSRFDAMDTLLLDAIEKGDIGFAPSLYPGVLLAVAPLGQDIIGFTAHGMTKFNRVDNRYAPEKVMMTGLMGRAALYSTGRELVWLDSTKTLYRWMLGEGIDWTHRGYFDSMAVATTIITYDPHEMDFYIADTDTCYVKSVTGLGGPFTVHPMSLYRDDAGVLIGTAEGLTASPLSFRLVTTTLDLNERGTKHCGVFQVQVEGVTGLRGTVAFRYGHAESFQEFDPGNMANPKGVINMNISFVDGRAVLTGTHEGSAEIQQIEFRYLAEDRSARRGTKGIPDQG
jgi:hypothetical protein